jgi:hypothetical protein
MKGIFAFALLVAGTSGALAQPVPSPIFSPLGPNSALLSVSAEGQSRREPDLALFSAGVVTQADTAAEALAANSRRMERVVAALKAAGIAERDIQTSAISLQPRYTNPEPPRPYDGGVQQPEAPRIVGYEAHNNVQVRVRRLDRMGRIIDTLVSEGANQVNGPSFTLDEPSSALDEARTEAVANARKRAELYARAAGMRVARILTISEGGGYYPMQESFAIGRAAMAPPAPPTPVAPGELTLGVSVSVQFELVR